VKPPPSGARTNALGSKTLATPSGALKVSEANAPTANPRASDALAVPVGALMLMPA
jgi:hypothetical protein